MKSPLALIFLTPGSVKTHTNPRVSLVTKTNCAAKSPVNTQCQGHSQLPHMIAPDDTRTIPPIQEKTRSRVE